MANKGFGWVGEVMFTTDWGLLVALLTSWADAWFGVSQAVKHIAKLPIEYERAIYPEKQRIIDAIKDGIVAYFGDAHGHWYTANVKKEPVVELHVDPDLSNNEGTGAMDDRDAMKFVFITHCTGMRKTEAADWPNWAQAFSKGSTEGTVVIGLDIDKNEDFPLDPSGYVQFWYYFRFRWLRTFFHYVGINYTFQQSWEIANECHPDVAKYVRFYGDKNMTRLSLV
jgi:hypothetical protein